MAEFGLEVRDADGNIALDSQHLTHRLWHWGIYSENTSVTYASPISHEPTLVVMGIGGYGAPVTHRKNGAQYVGFSVGAHPRGLADKTLVVVFIRE